VGQSFIQQRQCLGLPGKQSDGRDTTEHDRPPVTGRAIVRPRKPEALGKEWEGLHVSDLDECLQGKFFDVL
jgi:hypothetical protein